MQCLFINAYNGNLLFQSGYTYKLTACVIYMFLIGSLCAYRFVVLYNSQVIQYGSTDNSIIVSKGKVIYQRLFPYT